jgi:hypothetical protein
MSIHRILALSYEELPNGHCAFDFCFPRFFSSVPLSRKRKAAPKALSRTEYAPGKRKVIGIVDRTGL